MEVKNKSLAATIQKMRENIQQLLTDIENNITLAMEDSAKLDAMALKPISLDRSIYVEKLLL